MTLMYDAVLILYYKSDLELPTSFHGIWDPMPRFGTHRTMWAMCIYVCLPE